MYSNAKLDWFNKQTSKHNIPSTRQREMHNASKAFIFSLNKPKGKVRAKNAAFSATKPHAVGVAPKPSYSCVAKHDEYN